MSSQSIVVNCSRFFQKLETLREYLIKYSEHPEVSVISAKIESVKNLLIEEFFNHEFSSFQDLIAVEYYARLTLAQFYIKSPDDLESDLNQSITQEDWNEWIEFELQRSLTKTKAMKKMAVFKKKFFDCDCENRLSTSVEIKQEPDGRYLTIKCCQHFCDDTFSDFHAILNRCSNIAKVGYIKNDVAELESPFRSLNDFILERSKGLNDFVVVELGIGILNGLISLQELGLLSYFPLNNGNFWVRDDYTVFLCPIFCFNRDLNGSTFDFISLKAVLSEVCSLTSVIWKRLEVCLFEGIGLKEVLKFLKRIRSDMYQAIRIKASEQARKCFLIQGVIADGVKAEGGIDSFCQAVIRGNIIRALELSIYDASVYEKKYQYGLTALHHAAIIGNVEMVNWLLEQGAKGLNEPDDSSKIPIHYAALHGHRFLFYYLCNIHCDFDRLDLDLNSIYHFLAQDGEEKMLAIATTCSIVTLNGRNTQGCTALHIAAKKGHLRFVKRLIELGADSEVLNNDGHKAYTIAIMNKHYSLALYLEDRKHGEIERSLNPWSYLHIATEVADFNLIKTLVKFGGINLKSNRGTTPLHIAIANNHVEIVKCLLENGADFTCKHEQGFTPTQLAMDSLDILALILHQASPDSYPGILYDSAIHGNFASMKYILDQTRFDLKNSDVPVLHAAAAAGQLSMVKWLVMEMGFNVNCINGEKQNAPIHHAAKNGYVELVEWLVKEGGADPILRDLDKNMAVHLAALHGKLNVVKWFLDWKKDYFVKAQGNGGMNVLHMFTISKNQTGMAWLVEEMNVDILLTDNYIKTPLEIAVSIGDMSLVTYIVNQAKKRGLARKRDFISAIRTAIDSVNTGIVKWLVNNGIVGICYNSRELAIAAVGKDNVEILEILVNEGKLSLNCLSKQYDGALHYAAYKGKLMAMKWMLEVQKMDQNEIGNSKRTILHAAASSDNLDLVKWLVLERGMSVVSQAKGGKTPSTFAWDRDIREWLYQQECISLENSNAS